LLTVVIRGEFETDFCDRQIRLKLASIAFCRVHLASALLYTLLSAIQLFGIRHRKAVSNAVLVGIENC